MSNTLVLGADPPSLAETVLNLLEEEWIETGRRNIRSIAADRLRGVIEDAVEAEIESTRLEYAVAWVNFRRDDPVVVSRQEAERLHREHPQGVAVLVRRVSTWTVSTPPEEVPDADLDPEQAE